MKKGVFLIILAVIMVVFAGANPTPVIAGDEPVYKVFLPLVVKPFYPPECVVNATNGQVPNFVTFDIICQNVPDGWAHMEFDTLGYDAASTDVLLIDGVGVSDHYYQWPFTSFNARLTVTGGDGNTYIFDKVVTVNWP